MVKISLKNSKLGRIRNISLPPVIACRGGVPCTKKCYALKAYRQYKQTRAAWSHNLDCWHDDPRSYFDSIYEQLRGLKPNYFRWHVAGDIQNKRYLDGMIDIACALPDWHFLAFTKQYSIVNSHIDLHGDLPPNLKIVMSEWPGLTMENPHNLPVATFDAKHGTDCPGSCASCKLCWHSDSTINFPAH